MSYPKALIRLTPKRGFISDTPAHEVGPDAYTGCRNVIFRDGYATRVLGSRDAYVDALAAAAPAPIQLLHGLNAESAGTNFWLVFDASGNAWSLAGSAAVKIDAGLFQGTSNPFLHSSGLLNGVPVYSNGVDSPAYWDASTMVTLPDWTPTETCQFMAVFKFHLFALNISGPGGVFTNLVKWSAAAEPGTVPSSWTPAADNEAGSVELSDSPGGLTCAYPLRDSLMLYKRSSMYIAQYVGGNNVFNFRKIQSASGALGSHSVCDINGKHFVVTDGDVVLTDGTSRLPLGETRIKRWLFNQLDQDNFRNLFCTYSRSRDEVLIGFPESGNQFATLALVYDITQDSFGVRELDNVAFGPVGFVNDTTPENTWQSRTDVWQTATDFWGQSELSAARDSMVFVKQDSLEMQDTGDAVNRPASLSKYLMDFGEPERVKFIKRVHIKTDPGFNQLLVRVGGAMTTTGPTTWSNEIPLNEPDQIVNLFAIGRYISVEIRTIGSDVWRVSSIQLEGEVRGYF